MRTGLEERNVERRDSHARRWLVLGAMLPTPLLLAVIYWRFWPVDDATTTVFVMAAAMCSWVLFPLLAGLALVRRRAVRARVGLDGGRVVIGDGAGEEVTSGHLRPVAPLAVRLRLAAGEAVDLQVHDRAEAARALAALGLDAGKRRASFVAATSWARAGIGFAVTALAVFALFAAATYLPALADLPHDSPVGALLSGLPGILGYVAGRLVPLARVTVGTDGVLTERFRRRLVRFEEIAAARASDGRLCMTLHTGEELRARLGDEAEAVVARIDEARAARSAARTSPLELDLAGSLAAARSRLAQLLDVSYRGGAVTADQLLDVLADPGAALGRRVAAAWALRLSQGEAVKARARIAVEQLAEPRARILVDKALDDALAEADLEEIARQPR